MVIVLTQPPSLSGVNSSSTLMLTVLMSCRLILNVRSSEARGESPESSRRDWKLEFHLPNRPHTNRNCRDKGHVVPRMISPSSTRKQACTIPVHQTGEPSVIDIGPFDINSDVQPKSASGAAFEIHNLTSDRISYLHDSNGKGVDYEAADSVVINVPVPPSSIRFADHITWGLSPV